MADNIDVKEEPAATETVSSSLFHYMFYEITSSPMNFTLLAIILVLIYKIVKDCFEVPSSGNTNSEPSKPALPKLRRDFTVQELRQFDGSQPDGRVLIAVNGYVYDVTKGKHFYGPGGPYATFAGRDASRNLATFSVVPNDKEEYDDLSDLSAMEMDSVREWEMQIKEKYEYVGKLLRKGEQPTNYDEEEDEDTATANVKKETKEQNENLRKREVTDTKAATNSTSSDQLVD